MEGRRIVTTIILLLMSAATGALGYIVWSRAASSIQQIAALVIFLHADMLFCAAAIVSILDQSRRESKKQMVALRDVIARSFDTRQRADVERLRQISE
jgi:hypothetical protein